MTILAMMLRIERMESLARGRKEGGEERTERGRHKRITREIGLRETGEVDVGTGTHKCRTGVTDHKYF